ncbi:MAG TPA: hypothetical protein VFL86_17575 [Burkholderiaceae bacterium]|nr:hypothetical protein [Burkholderiaceae bacterium]
MSGPASPSSTPPSSPTSKRTFEWLDGLVQRQVAAVESRFPQDEPRVRWVPAVPPEEPWALSGPETGLPATPQARQRKPEMAMPTPASLCAEPPDASSGLVEEREPSAIPMQRRAPGLQAQVPVVTLTQEQAKWVPRWYQSGAGLPAEPAASATFRLPHPDGAAMRGRRDSLAARWCSSLDQHSRVWDAALALQGHDDIGGSSQGSTAEMFSARSSASWLCTSPAAEDPPYAVEGDTCNQAWTDAGGEGLPHGSSDHLELSSLRSVSKASDASARSRKGALSSGCIPSLSSDSPGSSRTGQEIADPVDETASGKAWSYRVESEDLGDQSSAASSPRSSRHGGGTWEALPKEVSPLAAPVQQRDPWLAVEQAYTKMENAMASSILEYGRLRCAYGDLKDAMVRAGGIQIERLSALLAREDEAIRRRYGRTRLQSLTMMHDVNAGWDAKKRSARNDQLQWIKDEQASLAALAAGISAPASAKSLSRSSSSSLSSFGLWARRRFASKKHQAGRSPSMQWSP